jgi:NAD(P)-dependent dehydrogenase (short-subunit alcohol dehydrogenase family)
LVTGSSRGLGRDLVLHGLERGAAVVATVRTTASRDELIQSLPAEAPLAVVVADLERPGALAAGLTTAGIEPRSIDIAIACAGVKWAGASALSLEDLRRTFEVNLFAAAELGAWFCSPKAETPGEAKPAALVLVSSMGRWHGMHESGGYNASKAALSIWGESVEMDLQRSGRRTTVTIVEPGLFASGMTRPAGPARRLLASRREIARVIVEGALAGRRSIRPPAWFALLTWSVLPGGRRLRARLFGRVKPGRH